MLCGWYASVTPYCLPKHSFSTDWQKQKNNEKLSKGFQLHSNEIAPTYTTGKESFGKYDESSPFLNSADSENKTHTNMSISSFKELQAKHFRNIPFRQLIINSFCSKFKFMKVLLIQCWYQNAKLMRHFLLSNLTLITVAYLEEMIIILVVILCFILIVIWSFEYLIPTIFFKVLEYFI